MHIITLLNEKGGVGKTTLAVHIAAGLALRGWRTLVIDADPQGHATVALGGRKQPGLYELLVREAPFKEVVKVVPPQVYAPPEAEAPAPLYLVPSNIETRVIPMMISDALKFNKRVRMLKDAVDVVVIDTAPTPSLLHASIYLATDGIIYPTKCEYLSFDGLVESFQHRDAARPMREQYELGAIRNFGIVPTMYRASTLEHSENLKTLRQQFGHLVWQPIPQRTIWAEASSRHQTVFAIAPESKAAGDAWRLVEQTEERIRDESQKRTG